MKRIAIVAGAVALSVGLLELGVRATMPQTLGPAIFEAGAEGFGQLKRGADVRLHGPEYDVRIRTNSQGLRDVEREYAKPSGVFRILAVGDSFTMGAGVSLEETYVKRVEHTLNQESAGIRHDVINAGVQNWGTGEQLVFLQKEWLRYEPDLVVLAFQHTDFTDNLNHHVWELRSGTLRRLPVRQSEPTGGFVSRVPGYRWTVTHSQAAVYARNTFFKFLAARDASDSQHALADGSRKEDRAADYSWQLTERLLSELHRVVAEHHIPFVIVYVPSREDVDDYARTRRDGEVEHFLARFAGQHAVPYMTLVPAFAAAGNIRDLYYPRDGHWTAKGHQIASDAVVGFLRRLHD